jgi:hypothetical protein
MRFPLAAALSSVLLLPRSQGLTHSVWRQWRTPERRRNAFIDSQRMARTRGAVVPIGHPDDVARISGIAFASYDLLYATTLGGGGFPDTPPPPNPSRLI